MRKFFISIIQAAAVLSVLSIPSIAQQIKRTPLDVTNYVMDVNLVPSERRMDATVDVAFTPLEDTRSVAFELNGSLKIDSIVRIGGEVLATTPVRSAVKGTPKTVAPPQSPITFVQDQSNSTDLGPHVRIDLGDTIAMGTTLVLRFKYSGVLDGPAGGPSLNRRFAHIGNDLGYLMYAARWFPFNRYAADASTSDITISLPTGYQVSGYSDTPVSVSGNKYRYVQSSPALPGNFAYGKFSTRNLKIGEQELQFFTKVGNDELIARYGETIGKALTYYTKRFGQADYGRKLAVIQIDDESLEYYSARGMLFIGSRQFEEARDITFERVQREAAYQWWGLTVGLKSFDDAWLSQGLAEYSAFSLRESDVDEAKLDSMRRELLERSLTFEQTSSLHRAPIDLDDLSIGYQYIMFSKGAFVYKLLRDTLGEQKFDQLLRTYLKEFRGKSASVEDFEKLTSRIAGQNMRYFFARWVESTGVPEFTSDYLIIRTRGGKFITRGTIKQNYDNLKLPVEIQLRSEGDLGIKTVSVDVEDSSAEFNIESTGKPISVIIDPGYKILRISPDLRVSSIARRGIEQFKEGNFVEAQQQFEAALKLDRSNSWIYYHLGLLFLEQRNFDLAIDNFKATLGGNLNPGWLAVWANIKMGNAYDAKGDRTRAVAAYKRAQELGDDYDKAQDAVKRYQDTAYDPREGKTAIR